MTDDRLRDIVPVGTIVQSITDKLAANAAFADGFRCPRHEGQPVPCAADPTSAVPFIPAPFGRMACPIMEKENCPPFVAMCDVQEGELAIRWTRWAESQRIPAKLRTAQLKTSEQTSAVTRVRDYIANDYPKGLALILAGGTGVGKSWAAVGALREIFGRNAGAGAFFFFPAWVGAILTPDLRDAAMSAVKHTPFVVLDDLGREYLKVGGMADAKIDELVFEREGNARPTLITTNLSPDEMKARLSPPTWDRIRGWARWYDIRGKSLRTLK